MPSALIVDDEPEANRLLARLVGLRGYRTASAYSAAEALDALAREPFDIVFLDLMLPDASGFDVCEAIKADPKTHGVPVVIVSARLGAESRSRGFRLGAAEYIPKPYTPDQIFGPLDLARSWRDALVALPDRDEFRIDADDEAANSRAIARLRFVLLDRLPALAGDCCGVVGRLAGWADALVSWARPLGHRHPALLSYAITPEALTITIRDLAGWSSAPELGAGLAPGFERVGDDWRLVRRLPAPSHPTSP